MRKTAPKTIYRVTLGYDVEAEDSMDAINGVTSFFPMKPKCVHSEPQAEVMDVIDDDEEEED